MPNNNGKAWINISEAYNCASHICCCHILCSGVIFRQYFVSKHQPYSDYILKRMYIWTIFSKYTYFMVKWSQNLIFISALLSPLSCTEYNEGLLQLKIISKTTWGAHHRYLNWIKVFKVTLKQCWKTWYQIMTPHKNVDKCINIT